jgi:NAD(P)H-quinone oxidoreductase subunit 4
MLLSTLIWFPVLGAAIVACLPKTFSTQQIRAGAVWLAGGVLLWTIWLLTQFDIHNPTLQFREYLPWIETLGLNYELGVDGLSIVMLALNSFLTWISLLSSGATTDRPRLFYSLVLLISGGVAGAFLAQNLLLFFFFYELQLVPFYLLISIWSSEKKGYAAIKFLIYTATSGILILAGFLGLVWLTGASNFSYQSVLGQTLPMGLQLILLGLLVVGFGIKIPLVPFHTWLPDTYVAASTPIVILLGGILAKLGTYGIFRFGLGLFPEAWSIVSPYLATWAAVSILYGAMAAIAQKDIKRMVAYSSIGHMGYVLLGAAALTPLALVGAVSQMVAHGLILALLFHLVGVIETKVGSRELDVLNGLLNPIRGLPSIASLLILAAMASAGIPGLAGFIAEFLVFQGSYAAFPWQTLLAVIGTGLTAVYFVILLNRTCFGKLDNATAYYPKVYRSDKVPALILAVLILFLGIQPVWLVRWTEATTTAFVAAAPSSSPLVVGATVPPSTQPL